MRKAMDCAAPLFEAAALTDAASTVRLAGADGRAEPVDMPIIGLGGGILGGSDGDSGTKGGDIGGGIGGSEGGGVIGGGKAGLGKCGGACGCGEGGAEGRMGGSA